MLSGAESVLSLGPSAMNVVNIKTRNLFVTKQRLREVCSMSKRTLLVNGRPRLRSIVEVKSLGVSNIRTTAIAHKEKCKLEKE